MIDNDDLKGAALPAAGLSARDKLKALLKRHGAAKPPAAKIARGNAAGGVLSFSQQRLWLLERLMGASPAYNISFAIRLDGRLDVDVLGRCLHAIVARHETLRTRFVAVDDEARMVVDPAWNFALAVEDINCPGDVHSVRRSERNHLFDIGKEALFRVRLLKESEDSHVLVATMHHIVSDAWSLGVFFKELVGLYRDFNRGQPASLAELPIQFADYALWQRETLTGAALSEKLDYWKRQLAHLPPLLTLPLDRPRPVEQRFDGATEAIHIPADLTAALQRLGKAHGATLFMTLLSAYAILLGRYAGQNDVAVGVPVANRMRREAEELIGFFVNTLVMRTDLSGNPPFLGLLGNVRGMALDAYANQDVPFEYLVEALNPERSLSHNPLFQTMFILQNTPMDVVTLDGVKVSRLDGEGIGAFSRFDITLNLTQGKGGEDGIEGVFEYNTGLFERSTIERMAEQYVRLLRVIVAAPESRLASLNFLSDREMQQQHDWNDTHARYAPACIHDAVAAQVRRTPRAVAVVEGERSISYAALDERAERLALMLVRDGTRVGDRVGICMDRSIDLVVAMYAVLKAGGAYVAIDPDYPAARIGTILRHAEVSRLLSRPSTREKLLASPEGLFAGLDCWCIDGRESAPDPSHPSGRSEAEAGKALPAGLSGEHAAYLIYTSGSTGVPKGVVGCHRSVMNRLTWLNGIHPVAREDVFCQKTSVSFVDHVAEIFQALTCGAPLVILPNRLLQSATDFLGALRRHRITRLTVVPSLLHTLLTEQVVEACTSLRLLITSGEALVVKNRHAFARHFPNARLLNLYGSTEVGADVTAFEVLPQHEGAVPIGRPIANSRAYVLDGNGRLLPQGAVGELFIGGDGLAQGYLKQPGLSAERFVPDVFGASPGARLFRTGDLVRYRGNGDLEYLGRADHQVKIRGFRIELGEIDVTLRTHPAVERAVTVLHADSSDGIGDRLVAYVVVSRHADAPPALGATQLKDYLKARLPHYMVPAVIEYLDAIPLTSTGKVDRSALPAPKQAKRSHEAPVGEHEALLADLWHAVLKCRQVGRHDNFFELGGHSLLATQLISRIRERFNVELAPLDIFEHQTLAEQTRAILAGAQGAGADPASAAIVPMDKTARLLPQALSFAQQRLWFLDQLMGANPAYNIASAVMLEGELDVSVLERSLNGVLERHDSLRAYFLEIDGNACQATRPHVRRGIALEILDDDDAIERAALAERMHCFDLKKDDLVRIRLLRTKHTRSAHVLLVTIHHIVADGWSLGVFFQEMAAHYRALLADGQLAPDEPAMQYVDFANWQRTWLADGALEAQLDYWRNQLLDLPSVLDLPTNRPRPAEQSFRGSVAPLVLDADLLDGLKALARQQGVTLFMVLLAAFAALLQRYTGQSDIAIGTPIANRTRREFERVIGLFANTLVMRSDLSGNPSFNELLKRTRRTALEAYAHQDVPFERLVEELNPARSLSYSPLFQVMFVLQNAPMDVETLDDLSIFPMTPPQGTGVSRFDLHLALAEANGELSGRIEYNSDIFDLPRIRQFAAHFESLLKAIVASPETPLGQIGYLSAEERRQLLAGHNATAKPFPRDATLKSLFESQVERTPDAIAVQFGKDALTYRELNARANRLAMLLISRHVRRDDCIGLYAERSLEMVIGIYGILKAGCAYLPLDPEYPQDRIASILNEAKAGVVLSHHGLADEMAGRGIEVVDLCAVGEIGRREDEGAPNPVVADLTSRHLAYVLFTSGSTGGPKGVMLEHQAVVNRILWMQDEYRLEASDVVLQKTPFSFDVSVWEFVWPLIVGARLVVAAPNGHRDPGYLTALIRETGVTTLHFVPSMLQGMLSFGHWQDCKSVRRVFCSGEALSPEQVKSFFASGTGSELHNLYGPTEAAIDVSYWQCPNSAELAVVPIGKPIQNIQLHVVDDQQQLVPDGVAGELLIGGVGLARGYINQPALTREKFLDDPFFDEPGNRVYRTGDLVRRLPGGDIEYLGRIDNQVKINGFRIELGEIENQLDRLDVVEKSVVIADREGGGARLVAYIVLRTAGTEVPVAQIKEHLSSCLPSFMVPQFYLALESMPLNANGKLERKRLPKLERQHFSSAQYVAPETEMEKQLAEVWEQNLRMERISVVDNYFSLGGDSIRSIALVAQARQIGIEFQVKDLFVNSTIRSLGQAIDAGTLRHAKMEMPEAFGLITEEERKALLESFS